jgi:hypothetical protein
MQNLCRQPQPLGTLRERGNEKGVGDRVWGVGNPILKSRGFKMDAVFLAHTCLAIHLFLFSIFKNRGLYPLGVGERSLPTPHTPHPSWSKVKSQKFTKPLNLFRGL